MTHPCYLTYRVMADLCYAGMWFRVDGDDLYVTGNTGRLTDAMRFDVKRHKAAIIEAVSTLPAQCVRPTVCLNIGHCEQCQSIGESEGAA